MGGMIVITAVAQGLFDIQFALRTEQALTERALSVATNQMS